MVRNSKQREAILKVLREPNSHPTAEQVHEQVRKKIPNISLGTVYRNLKLLQLEEKVLELDFANGKSRFDGNPQNHYHFRCEQCGRVFNIDEPVHREIDKRLARKTGFKFYYHRLEFCGLCKDCRS